LASASGIEHSEWMIGIYVVHDGDAPRLEPDGAPVERLVFFPASAAEIIDTRRVSGLRGTGSHDYRVTDLFTRLPSYGIALDDCLTCSFHQSSDDDAVRAATVVV
jgi:hypothetical protein